MSFLFLIVSDVRRPWSTEEQKLLEQAIRTYPTTTPQRWDKIAEMVSSRTKEECVLRFKVRRSCVLLHTVSGIGMWLGMTVLVSFLSHTHNNWCLYRL